MFKKRIVIVLLLISIFCFSTSCKKQYEKNQDTIVTIKPTQELETKEEATNKTFPSPVPVIPPEYAIMNQENKILKKLSFQDYLGTGFRLFAPIGWETEVSISKGTTKFNSKKLSMEFFVQIKEWENSDEFSLLYKDKAVEEALKKELNKTVSTFEHFEQYYEPEVIKLEGDLSKGFLILYDKEKDCIIQYSYSMTKETFLTFRFTSKKEDFDAAVEIMAYMTDSFEKIS